MRSAAASGVVEGVVTHWHLEPACQGVSPNSGDEAWHGAGENSGLAPVHLRPLRGEAMTQRRWLARSAFALLLAAAAVMIGFAGLGSVAMVAVGAVGTSLVVAGAYRFLAQRGVLRWPAFAVVIIYSFEDIDV
jgi:hypothetical protein